MLIRSFQKIIEYQNYLIKQVCLLLLKCHIRHKIQSNCPNILINGFAYELKNINQK
jgi:hypothetical protein